MTVPLVLGITLVGFAMMKALPGDPVEAMVGERARPEVIESIRSQIGSDKSAVSQYFGYLEMLIKGNLGSSFYTNRPVAKELLSKFPNTLALAICAMLIAAPLGVALGLSAAYRRGTKYDRYVTGITILGISMPVFWIGLVLMMILSFNLRLFPPSGSGELRFIVLPAMTLAIPAAATIMRVTRSSVLEVMDMPYVQTAHAKGLDPMRVKYVHILRNAMIPIITIIGLDFASYLNGAVLTETIFGWDGIGRFAMEGIRQRDYPVVMGVILLGTVFFVLINLTVDIAYNYLDPRIRVQSQGGGNGQ